jgi:Smg protein
MFEVLVFVYENYWRGDACPEAAHLERKLNSVGFEADEIQDALIWLNDLNLAAGGLQLPTPQNAVDASPVPTDAKIWMPSPDSMRAYTLAEQNQLGVQCLGFITFLETAGALPAHMRELVIDRAMAAPAYPLPLEDLKIIILMVFWSLGKEPDALVLDELCEVPASRVAH